jgi:hypothetical protein
MCYVQLLFFGNFDREVRPRSPQAPRLHPKYSARRSCHGSHEYPSESTLVSRQPVSAVDSSIADTVFICLGSEMMRKSTGYAGCSDPAHA